MIIISVVRENMIFNGSKYSINRYASNYLINLFF